MTRSIHRATFASAALLTLAAVARAQVVPPTTHPVRILAIGNSFSRNATADLPEMLKAGGKQWLFGHAMIGGASMGRHLKSVDAFEADPASPAGKPYRVPGDNGKPQPASLRDLLQSQPWDYVTIQQASINSFDPATFEPDGQRLVAYVHKYAPQAKVVIHETWAYRADSGDLKPHGLDQAQMYARLHKNYGQLAKDVDAVGIIPVGSAFQNVREDARWHPFLLPKPDLTKFHQPDLPPEDHDLNAGWTWSSDYTPPKIVPDRHHATAIGRYLGACVWYEFFFGDVRGNAWRPDGVSDEDARLMQDVAHKTVADHLQPGAASVPIHPLAAAHPATAPAR